MSIKKIINNVAKEIEYIAIAEDSNIVIFPKKVYFANSTNTLKLVYERPSYDIHIINLAINSKLGYANKVSEIVFTNNLQLRNQAYNDNVVNVTYQNNLPTFEFLVQNDDNDTFTCYIANAFYSQNKKVFIYDCKYCFRGLKLINTLDISVLDTSQCSDFSGMFSGCNAVRIIQNINLSNANFIAEMFADCHNLKYLDTSNFRLPKAKYAAYMFLSCDSLITLNLTNLFNNITNYNVNYLNYFFDYCISLKRIFAPTICETASSNKMFLDCNSIVGGNGTTYDSNHVNSEYARIDGENGLPGYFTDPTEAIKITLINVDNEGYTDEIYLCAGDTYTIPALDGYTGVITDNNGNTYSDGDSITITQDITLTFVWSAI